MLLCSCTYILVYSVDILRCVSGWVVSHFYCPPQIFNYPIEKMLLITKSIWTGFCRASSYLTKNIILWPCEWKKQGMSTWSTLSTHILGRWGILCHSFLIFFKATPRPRPFRPWPKTPNMERLLNMGAVRVFIFIFFN